MISQYWSLALTVLGAFGLVLVFRFPNHWIGPVWSIVLQVVWFSYAIASEQWAFLASAFMYGGANIYGIVQRRKANAVEK